MKWKQREFEFRAWNGTKIRYKVSINNNGVPVRYGYQWYDSGNDLKTAPVMQYTGVKDINGKKIFEGDIVKVTTEDKLAHATSVDQDYTHYCIVTYNEGDFDLSEFERILMSQDIIRKFEVIGNVFQNPELVEQYKLEIKSSEAVNREEPGAT